MPTLDIAVSNFKGAYATLNGIYSPNVSRLKCLKFATTVGTSHFSRAFGRTPTAVALAAYRAKAVECVIDFNNPSLRPLPEYSQLDPSEKTNLSYWIGMTFAAITADHVLDIPRTIHAYHLGRRIRKVKPKSPSLADLAGQDSVNDWHVFEAKGRQNAPSNASRNDWKAQARTVRSIDNSAVATRSYCVGLIANPFRVELVDPPPRRDEGVDVKLDPDDHGRGYYRPYIEFVRADPRKVLRDDRVFLVRPILYDPIKNGYVYLGLEDRYFFLDETTPFEFKVTEYEDESMYAGTDGVVVIISSGPCDFQSGP